MNSLFSRLTLFLGCFFASVPGVVDTGGGADATDTGGSDGATTGDVGTSDTGDTGESIEPEIDTADVETETDEAIEGQETDQTRDQRMLPDAVKKGLNKLRETDPKLASELRKAYFESSDFKKTFPTPGDARMAKETIESLGGEEGIASMQKEVSDYAQELTHFAQGNPQAIEDMVRDYPQGLVKLTPVALDKMRSIDPAAYDRTIAQHMISTLKDKGVVGTVDRVLELIEDGKQVPAKEMMERLRSWLRGVEQLGTSKPADEPDARKQEYEQREQELATEKQRLFTERVSSAVLADMDKVMTRYLQPFLKNRKLTPEQVQATKSDIRGRVAASLQVDKGYQSRLKALISDGDAAKVQAFINSNFAERAAKATAKVWALRGYAGSTARRAAGTGTNGSTAAVQSTKPDAEQIDWTKDQRRDRYMRGEATLKNGKIVKWQNW